MRPPGPPTPWFGIPLLRAMARDYLGFLQGLQRAHGDAVYMKIGVEHTYEFFTPELARQVLVDQAKSFVRWERGIEVFAQAHGQSVLVTEGDVWQRQRRLLQPGFGPKRMQGYGRLMVAAARGRLDQLVQRGAHTLDIEHEMTQLTMDVIMRTLFSSKVADDALAAEEAVRVLTHVAMREMFMPMTLPDWLPLPGKARKRWALRTLDALVHRHIAERQAVPAQDHATPDLLDMLLAVRDEQGQPLAAQEIRDQCMTIFQAGHETTATALTWWSHAMATHPALQQQAADEVASMLAEREPTIDSLAAMPYLAATVKEAMRLYPPVPALMSRRAIEAVQIGPWQVPKARWCASRRGCSTTTHAGSMPPASTGPSAFCKRQTLRRAAPICPSAQGRGCAWASTSRWRR